MTTRYDWFSPSCGECGRFDGPLVIGRKSGGWAFALHSYVDDPHLPHSLEDWIVKIPKGNIRDEYGNELTPVEMLGIILVGPGSRHDTGSRYLMPGAGPWDLMKAEEYPK